MAKNPLFKITPYKLYDAYKDHELLMNVMENDAIYGNKNAMNIMGTLSTNEDEILKWFSLAAEKKQRDAMYNLGIYYKHKNQTEEMLKWFMKAVELGDMDANYELAVHYYKDCSFGIMMKYMDEGICKSHGNTLQLMITFCKEKKDHVLENKYLMMCQELNLLLPRQKQQLADTFCHNGNFPDALILYLEILDAYFKHNIIGEIYDNVVTCIKFTGDKEALKAFVEQAVSHKHPKAYYDYGMMLRKQGKSSMQYFVDGSFYNEPNCLYMVGVHHHRAEDFESAKKYFDLAAVFGHIKSRYQLGVMCESEKDFDGMLYHFEKIGSLYNGAAYYKIAKYYMDIGKHEMAFEFYTLAANSGHIHSQLLLAKYYQKNGDDVNLFKYIELLHKHDTLHAKDESQLYIILARYYVRDKDYDAVRECLLKSLTTECAKNSFDNLLDGDEVIYKSLFIDRLTDDQKAKMKIQLNDLTIIEEHNKNHKDYEMWQYVDCIVCTTYILRAQIKEYDCKCTKKHCCSECIDKMGKCPICHINIQQ